MKTLRKPAKRNPLLFYNEKNNGFTAVYFEA
jgi:hypothetical protein